jgi:RNA polymerase sigma factor (sigma-70 family)
MYNVQNTECVGYYKNVLQNHPLLNKEEERSLLQILAKYAGGKMRAAAREKLINSNIRLVIKEAARYSRNCQVPMNDLIGAGSIGLCKAIDRFDLQFGTKLSTYATPWIKLEILKFVRSFGAEVYVPSYILERSRAYLAASVVIGEKLMTQQELLKELEMTEEELQRVKLALKNHTFSLDAQIESGESESTIGQLVEDTRAVGADVVASDNDDAAKIRAEVAKLDSLSANIITRRYLTAKKERLFDVGKSLKISGERVRQIEFAALQTLKMRMKNRHFFNID